jgi:alpha-galactosidase
MKTASASRTFRLDFPELSLEVAATGEPRRLGAAEFIAPTGAVSLAHPFGDTEFYRHGWNSWSPTGWRRLSEPPLRIVDSPERLLTADDAAQDTASAHSGSAVGALDAGQGNILLLGALGLGAPRVGATDARLWGSVEASGGDWFIALGDEATVFNRYAELVADRLGARRRRAGRVWSTWYSHYDDVSEGLVRQTLCDLAGLPFDVFQLDDGWERVVGDWSPNRRFPSGMGRLAKEIAASGLRPGLWLAPFIALPGSRVARERPDLLLQGRAGSPVPAGYNWGGPFYSFDTTIPEVQDRLRALIERVVGWGFTYLKLDFMSAAAVTGRRRGGVHREQAYREAVTSIREAAGEDVYLLGSGVPLLPSAGVFDAVRVGPDVAAVWDNAERPGDPSGVGAKNALLASVNRVWLKGLYQTDPDSVYFRRRRSLLDEPQRQALQDLATVLGFKSTSDPPSWLDPAERDQLREWLESADAIRQTGRHTFEVNGRAVDFGRFMYGYQAPTSTIAG